MSTRLILFIFFYGANATCSLCMCITLQVQIWKIRNFVWVFGLFVFLQCTWYIMAFLSNVYHLMPFIRIGVNLFISAFKNNTGRPKCCTNRKKEKKTCCVTCKSDLWKSVKQMVALWLTEGFVAQMWSFEGKELKMQIKLTLHVSFTVE